MTDPVEMLALMHSPPKYDPLVNLLPPPRSIEQAYASLSDEDLDRFVRAIAERVARSDESVENMARCVAAFTDRNLDPLLETWLDHREPYPAILFRKAGPHVRERMTERLAQSQNLLASNEALIALATIGDDDVVCFLHDAQVQRPAWSRDLYIGPADYARTAGWEIVDGRRRELTFPTCVALNVVVSDDDRRSDHVHVFREVAASCPWCGGRLASLVAADLVEEPLASFSELCEHIEVLTCPVCTASTTVHAKLDAGGRGSWATENTRPKYLPSPEESATWEPSPWAGVSVSLTPRRPYHAADQFLPTTFSQIGGLPTWVQDAEYPRCLKCGQTMRFFAQFDNGAFPGNEGVYYAFVCSACRTTATSYQQT